VGGAVEVIAFLVGLTVFRGGSVVASDCDARLANMSSWVMSQHSSSSGSHSSRGSSLSSSSLAVKSTSSPCVAATLEGAAASSADLLPVASVPLLDCGTVVGEDVFLLCLTFLPRMALAPVGNIVVDIDRAPAAELAPVGLLLTNSSGRVLSTAFIWDCCLLLPEDSRSNNNNSSISFLSFIVNASASNLASFNICSNLFSSARRAARRLVKYLSRSSRRRDSLVL